MLYSSKRKQTKMGKAISSLQKSQKKFQKQNPVIELNAEIKSLKEIIDLKEEVMVEMAEEAKRKDNEISELRSKLKKGRR